MSDLRVVLGPRATLLGGESGAATVWALAAALLGVALLTVCGKEIRLAIFIGALPASVMISVIYRYFFGIIVEVDERELRVYPYGRVWRPICFPRESILAVEPWGEDEVTREGRGLERSPRLHIQFVTGDGRLFGPWITRDAESDYRRLQVVLGPLFRGEPELRR